MASEFLLEITTPEHTFFSGMVEMIIVDTIDGKMGILKSHLPIVTVLKTGEVDIKKDGKKRIASSSVGFMEVLSNKVALFLESIEWADEVDIERSTEAKERAEKALQNTALSQMERGIHIAALERANSRLKIAQTFKSDEKK